MATALFQGGGRPPCVYVATKTTQGGQNIFCLANSLLKGHTKELSLNQPKIKCSHFWACLILSKYYS